jgi:hypothetical protein
LYKEEEKVMKVVPKKVMVVTKKDGTNIHSEYIDKIINNIKRQNNWNTTIINTTHADFIRDFSSSVYSNIIKNRITSSYVKKYRCSDCGCTATTRCHGIGEERPVLIGRALKKVYPDITKMVRLKDVVIQFLEEHKSTKFTLKCAPCHKKENKVKK